MPSSPEPFSSAAVTLLNHFSSGQKENFFKIGFSFMGASYRLCEIAPQLSKRQNRKSAFYERTLPQYVRTGVVAAVGRVDASNTRDPWFESGHKQIYLLSTDCN